MPHGAFASITDQEKASTAYDEAKTFAHEAFLTAESEIVESTIDVPETDQETTLTAEEEFLPAAEQQEHFNGKNPSKIVFYLCCENSIHFYH